MDKGGSFFIVMKVSFDNRKGSWYARLKPAAPLEWDNHVFRLVADWETMEVVISSNALRAHIKWFKEWYKHPKFPELSSDDTFRPLDTNQFIHSNFVDL